MALDLIVSTLAESPILTLFVVIGLGYLLGEIRLFGFQLGVAGVLFAGLAVGALSPKIALPEVVTSLGLIIFVYTIGIQSGPAFFGSFRKQGYRDSLLAVAAVLLGVMLTVPAAWMLHLSGARAAGLYCGALTSTPALAAAREKTRERTGAVSDEPVVAYSLAYPFGVIGVIICFELARKWWRVNLEPAEDGPEIHVRDFIVKNPGVVDRTVADVLRLHRDPGFVISRIQQGDDVGLAKSDTVLTRDSIVAVVGDDEALERAQQIFGASSDTEIEKDRSRIDYRRVFVSSREVVGKTIRDLHLQTRYSATITRVRRGDADVVPSPDTRLELGDRVRVLTDRANFAAISKFFGDSIRGTAEADFGSVAIGMVLGVMVGMMPIPLPGGGVVRLGLAGGPLLVALLLGNLERTGRVTWVMPLNANLTLRQIGLLLFQAGVGTRAGYSFASTIRGDGWQLMAAGAVITFVVTATTLIAGHKLLKIPFDALMGLMSGVQTQTACLAYANKLSRSDTPSVVYAGVYPAAMIVKIVIAQLLVAMN